jgi:hypothetical protein
MRFIGRTVAILLVFVFLGLHTNLRPVLSQSSTASSANLDGFSTEGSTTERRWEEEFRSVPAPGSAREHLRRLTIEPHVAGTKEDYATAVYVRDQIRSYGISSELKEYEVLLPYPKQQHRGISQSPKGTPGGKGIRYLGRSIVVKSEDHPAVQWLQSERRRDGGAGLCQLRSTA